MAERNEKGDMNKSMRGRTLDDDKKKKGDKNDKKGECPECKKTHPITDNGCLDSHFSTCSRKKPTENSCGYECQVCKKELSIKKDGFLTSHLLTTECSGAGKNLTDQGECPVCRKKNPKVKDRVIDAHKMKCPGTEQKPIHTGVCPDCKKKHPINQNGDLCAHPSIRECPGTGKKPTHKVKRKKMKQYDWLQSEEICDEDEELLQEMGINKTLLLLLKSDDKDLRGLAKATLKQLQCLQGILQRK